MTILPLVSVIIPNFNQGRYLEQCVLSAKAAYEGPLQIMVVDDGSTEAKTEKYLTTAKAVGEEVIILRKKNGGLSSARNFGLSRISGDFVQFLDCDDFLIDKKITLQVQHLISSNNDISICNYLLAEEDQNNVIQEPYDVVGSQPFGINTFLYNWERGFSIPMHCGLFSREIVKDRKFDESVKGKEDWIFWTSLVKTGARLSYLPTYGAVYRQHPRSMTKANITQMGESWLRATEIISQMLEEDEISDFCRSSEHWFKSYYARQSESSDDSVCDTQMPSLADFFAEKRITDMIELLGQEVQRKPLISFIIPVYNHYNFLISCINSLVSQVNSDVEVILIDDCSTDIRVGEFLRAISQKSTRVTVVKNNKNLGISITQNRAVELSTGSYVAFLDCDDMLEKNVVEEICREVRQAPEVDYFFSNRTDIDENNNELRRAFYGGYGWLGPSGDHKIDLIDGMIASHLKIIKRTVYLEIGGCRSEVDGVQDWDLAQRVSEIYRLKFLDRYWYRHRIHSGSVTSADRMRQFRLSNRVRRTFSDRVLRPDVLARGTPEMQLQSWLRSAAAESSCSPSDFGVRVFGAQDLKEDGSAIRKAVEAAPYRVFYESDDMSLTELNWLREWNSYFDLILVRSLRSYIALAGFVWNQEILRFCHDFENVINTGGTQNAG